jgi:hypothetical protein
MRPIALAAIRAGLIDESTVAQFKRWGMIPRELDTSVLEDVDLAIERIQYALEDEEQVRLQSTDLDILQYYLDRRNQQKGQLVIVDTNTETKATKTVVFAVRSHIGRRQYIIPWVSESILEIITNGRTYLRYASDGKNVKVFFAEVAEMYFGEAKAFMVCDGIMEESNGHS